MAAVARGRCVSLFGATYQAGKLRNPVGGKHADDLVAGLPH